MGAPTADATRGSRAAIRAGRAHRALFAEAFFAGVVMWSAILLVIGVIAAWLIVSALMRRANRR